MEKENVWKRKNGKMHGEEYWLIGEYVDALNFKTINPFRGYKNDLLYIGNLDKGCQFNITISLLNKEDKGKFPDVEDFAYTVGKVNIIIE